MKTINIADLKANLSKYLRRVRGGERFVVLDRKEPIAELSPLKNARKNSYDQLVTQGRIIPSTKKLWELKFTKLKRSLHIQEALDEVRGDRL